VPDPQRFGVVEMRDGRVVRLVEKPKVPPSDLALVGIYLFDSTILTAARSIRPSPRGELEITDAIQWLVDNGYRVDSQLVTGWWKDTGKPEDVLDANRLVLDTLVGRVDGEVSEDSELSGRVVIEAGARVERSTIRGPAVIGAGALIQDAYIGPYTSIGAGVQVISAEVENSILLDGCVVRDLTRRMDASLLGKNVSVQRASARPAAMTLVLGDNSIARVLD
jgi:glucose-1-phosphate thymidylyltransferase